MDYQILHNSKGECKKHLFLLTFLLWMAGTMSTLAEEVFWVGSVKVNGEKSNNNIHGGNIKSGSVTYDASTKTLKLIDVYIYAEGSGGDVIHNKSCYGLRVEFYGDNDLNAIDTYAIWCEYYTSFTVKTGSTSIFNNKSGNSCVYLQAGATFRTENGAELDIQANNHYAIEGINNSDINLRLSGGNITIDGAKGSLFTLHKVEVVNEGGISDVTLYRTNNSYYPIVSNVTNMYDLNYYTANKGVPLIVTPAHAEFKNYSICDKSGNPIYASDIKINNDYVVPLGVNYFPDGNFANYWIDRFGSNALKQSHINSITSLDFSYKYFFSLVGIEYFKKLQTLNCSYNRLDALDLRDNPMLTTLTCNYSQLKQLYMGNTVTTVDCSNNGVTYLNIGNSVKTLDCSHNQLTSLNGGSSLKKLDCSYNKLTLNSINGSTIEEITCTNNLYPNLYFSDCSSLKKLDCRNNPEMTDVFIKNMPILTQFYVSGCSKLEKLTLQNSPVQQLDVSGCSNMLGIDCSLNQLTSISGLSGCSALTYLICYGNKLTSITGLSGKTTLKKVDCHSNLLQSLDVSGTTNLAELNCSSNNLTGLTLTNCLQLKQLDCTYNQLGFLNLSYLYSLQKVDCSYNKLTAINTYHCDNLYELICKSNNFSSLDLSDCPELEKLDCKRQSNLTSLNLENCWRLRELDCSFNLLTTLNLEGNDELKTLYCYYNKLTSINMPQISSLQTVYCFLNELKGSAMNAIVAALPNRTNTGTTGTFVAVYTGSLYTEGNVCTTKNVSDANAKYWSTYQTDDYGNILPYGGASIPTDIQMAEVDVDDDAPRYNLSGQRVGPDYKGVVIINGKKKLMK